MATMTSRQTALTGVRYEGGAVFNRDDFNARLAQQDGTKVYDEMRTTDAVISASLDRIIWPLMAASWTVRAAEEDSQGEEIAEFVESVLMPERYTLGSSLTTWMDTLRHVLLMVPFGFTAFERVWDVDEQGRNVYRELFPIHPRSVWKFEVDERGDLAAIVQRAYDTGGRLKVTRVEVGSAMVVTFGREAKNPWGRATLRPIYGDWYLKRVLLEVDAIRHEKYGGGIATLTMQDGVTRGQGAWEEAEKVVFELRSHHRQGAVLENGQKLEVFYPSGTGSDVIGSVKYHDEAIERALWSEFMSIGLSETGSRATHESKTGMLFLANQGVANVIRGAFNAQAIRPLVDAAFGVRPAYPTIEVEDLDKMTGDQLSTVLAPLVKAGVITPDGDLEEHVRNVLKFPAANPKTAKTPVGPEPSEDPDEDEDEAEDAELEAVKAGESGARLMIELRRDPLPHESACRWREMADFLEQEPQDVMRNAVIPVRNRQISKLAKALASGSAAEATKRPPPVPFVKEMVAAIVAALREAYLRGAQDVRQERELQLSEERVSGAITFQEGEADLDDDDIVDEVQRKASAKLNRKAEAFAVATGAALLARGMMERVAVQPSLVGAALERQIANAMGGLSTAVLEAEVAGLVATALAIGRNDQAAAIGVERAFYSAILDEGTCDACLPLDGDEHEPGDVRYETPNSDCESTASGSNRCRCVTVYVWESP